MFAVIFISFMLMYKERPDTPPSAVAEAPEQLFDFFDTFRLMCTNKNFGLLAMIFVVKQGTLNSFGLLLSDLLTPFGFSP